MDQDHTEDAESALDQLLAAADLIRGEYELGGLTEDQQLDALAAAWRRYGPLIPAARP
jgi:hypothetical protein